MASEAGRLVGIIRANRELMRTPRGARGLISGANFYVKRCIFLPGEKRNVGTANQTKAALLINGGQLLAAPSAGMRSWDAECLLGPGGQRPLPCKPLRWAPVNSEPSFCIIFLRKCSLVPEPLRPAKPLGRVAI